MMSETCSAKAGRVRGTSGWRADRTWVMGMLQAGGGGAGVQFSVLLDLSRNFRNERLLKIR